MSEFSLKQTSIYVRAVYINSAKNDIGYVRSKGGSDNLIWLLNHGEGCNKDRRGLCLCL